MRPTPQPRPADGAGRRFEMHVFVCVSESACMKDGPAMEIRNLLKSKLKKAGLKDVLRINQAGCLGQCGHGPMLVVYPEGVWYSHVSLEDAQRIWTEHIEGGVPVADLEFRTDDGGTNVLPMRDPVAREVDRASPHFSPCSRCP